MEPELVTSKYASGQVSHASWLMGDQLHRDDDLPAMIRYQENGSLMSQQWYRHGKLDRQHDQPAYIGYREDGSISFVSWYTHGQSHRDEGPAYILYLPNGETYSMWYTRGVIEREVRCYPEPSAEDLVKPAFSHRENRREPASGTKPDIREPAYALQASNWEPANSSVLQPCETLFDEE